jgi:hypothetical protein
VHAVGIGIYVISLELKWISNGAVNNLVWQGMPIAVSWFMWMTFFSAVTKLTGSVCFSGQICSQVQDQSFSAWW